MVSLSTARTLKKLKGVFTIKLKGTDKALDGFNRIKANPLPTFIYPGQGGGPVAVLRL